MAAPAAGRRRSRVAVVARVLAVVLLVVTLVVLVSLLPTLNRATPGMSEAAGERVVVHYEQEEAAALEVLATADEHAAEIEDALGVDAPLRYEIYVYDEQATMQRKRYGLLTGCSISTGTSATTSARRSCSPHRPTRVRPTMPTPSGKRCSTRWSMPRRR